MGEHRTSHFFEGSVLLAGQAAHLREPVDAHRGAGLTQGRAEAPSIAGEALPCAHDAQLVGEVVLEEAREHGGRQVGLRREVDVDRADRNATGGRDLAHGKRGNTIIRGDLVGLVDQLVSVDHLLGHVGRSPFCA